MDHLTGQRLRTEQRERGFLEEPSTGKAMRGRDVERQPRQIRRENL
jgi:hypothetical protein